MAKTFNTIARAALIAGTALVAMPAFAAEVEGWGDFKLYLDPGHEGHANQGLWGYSEAEKVLDIAHHIRTMLLTYTDMPEDCIKLCRETETDQISLEERSDEANAWGADFYYSIHSDAAAQNNTIVTLFGGWKKNGEFIEKTPHGGKAFGDFLEPNLKGVMRVGSRGNRYDRDFYYPGQDTHDNQYPYLSVNRRSNMASLLSEGGYHTIAEQQQRNMNADYKRLEAFAAFQSILQYRDLNRPAQTFLTGMVYNSENNQPLNGATITVGDRVYTTDTFESLFHKYTKNPDLIHNGFYLFEGLEAGSTVEVKFEAPGFETATETVTINGGGNESANYVTFLDKGLVNASPAKVDAISLSDLENVTPLYPLVITFSRTMDRASVEEAFSINNNGQVTLNWANDYTLKVDLTQLRALFNYTVKIDGSIAKNAQTGQFLDGDGDGVAGGDYILNFRMAEPDNSAPEVVSTYPDAEGEALYCQRPPISIEFNELLDWNDDTNTGWFEVVDSKGKTYEIGHVTHATVQNDLIGTCSVLMCYLAEDLDKDVAVRVSLKPVKDLSGNESAAYEFRFLSEYRNELTREELIPLNGVGQFWAPNGSGSTKGLCEEGNSAEDFALTPYHGANKSLSITYAFDMGSADNYWLIRLHNKYGSDYTLKNKTGIVTMWVYGDHSMNRTGFYMRDYGTNALVLRGEKMMVDFLGWRPFVWDLENDEMGNFTGTPGEQSLKKWYFDAIFIDHNYPTDVEPSDDPEDEDFKAWSGKMGFYELIRTTWDDAARTADINDIQFSGLKNAVATEAAVSVRNGIVSVSEAATFAVYGIDGRLEMAKAGSSLDLNGLGAGVHMVKVVTATSTRTVKVVL